MIGSEEKSKKTGELATDHGAFTRVRIIAPASSANLGPGFDALGLALKLYCTLTFDILPSNDMTVPLITLKGPFTNGLPMDQSNLIYTVLSNLWRSNPEFLQRVRLTIESEIPLGKGLGSSAAAVTGAVLASFALTGSVPDNVSLLAKAAQLEGHADNVAATLLGGLVVCSQSEKGSGIITQKLAWPEEWCPIVVVPQNALSTKQSRSVLPKTVKREDAVYNLQKVALLLAAVQNKDEDALREALHDRLHQPFRQSLVPQLQTVRRAIAGLPVLGTVLSGAGSSVLTLVNRRHRNQVAESLKTWAARQSEPTQILELEVDQEGLRVFYE